MATDMPYGWQKTGETYTCERCGKPTSNRKLFLSGKDGYCKRRIEDMPEGWCGDD